MLFDLAEVAIGVSHDGRRDPKRNGKLGYMSEDVFDCLTGHGRQTNSRKAQKDHMSIAGYQDNRTMFPKLGRAGGRLEGYAGHVGCRFDN